MFSTSQIRKAIVGFSRSEDGLNVGGIKKVLREKYKYTDAQFDGKLRKHLAEMLMNEHFEIKDTSENKTQNVETTNYTEDDVILFNHPKKKWGQLSNNFQYPFKFEGFTTKTAENHFQAAKFRYPDAGKQEQAYSKLILSTTTGNKAKMLGGQEVIESGYESKWYDYCDGNKVKLNSLIKEYSKAVPSEDWEELKEDVMLAILKTKFSNTDLKNVLLSTGKAQLVYKSKNDDYWGDSTEDETGENRLGELLMEVREFYQEKQEQ